MKLSESDNKRLAKNTLYLYLRTLLVMAISLYTSRVILSALGVDNYGIYNLIGGFVSMFSLVGGTLVSSTQRFINYEMGLREKGNVNKIFNTSLGIHIGLSILLLFVFETFGLWFLNAKLNIPEDRMFAANFTYQCSIFAFIVNILSLPYNAIIIAHERMKAFAYISLVDAVMKLAIAFFLFFVGYDLLIVYSILILAESLVIRLIYGIYCRKHFTRDTQLCLHKDKAAYLRQMGFAGYTFIGSSASILSGQGVNIIMNIFCGVTVNAARAIAIQVQHATEKFVSDFMTALNPQITKSYAAGETEKSIMLVFRGAKFSFYLVMLFSLPIIIRTKDVLDFWLTGYPDYAIAFVRLSLIYSMLNVLSKPIITEILATGRIKVNALVIGGVRLLILPLCYLALYVGYEPTICYVITIIVDIVALNIRLLIVKSITAIPMYRYYKNVILYIIPVLILSSLFGFALDYYFPTTIWALILFAVFSIVLSGGCCVLLGLNNVERIMVKSILLHKVLKK